MPRLRHLAITLLPVLFSASALGDTSDRSRGPDCALIESGSRRLACYDANRDPDLAREQAEEREIEEATEALESMAIKDQDGRDRGFATNLVKGYMAAEKALFSFSGSFAAHRPTYILPVTWMHDTNQRPFSPTLGRFEHQESLDNEEAKYQISFKVPLLTGVLDKRTTLWFGYTQLSFWQVFNTQHSAPFRETNYEPELFVRYQTNFDLGPGSLDTVALGIVHQSNGQPEPYSRSWNRIMATFTYSYDRWLFMATPWYRIPESDQDNDNPDLLRYIGYADYWATYKWSEDRNLSLRLRSNLRSSNNKTSVQLGYSFSIGDNLKGYIQYYNGYGESLVDYNKRIQRIGFGVMLNDWL